MAVAMKWGEVIHDLIRILLKSKWIKFSLAVCIISLNKKGDPQGKGSPYQEVTKCMDSSPTAIKCILPRKIIVSILLMSGRLFVSQLAAKRR